jgi:predicted ATPase
MEGKKLLHSIRLENLLSYGSEGVALQLEPLNVLIGPNASGKSNLIDALSLLTATTRNFSTPFRQVGGAESWLWSGAGQKKVANILARLIDPQGDPSILSYFLSFSVTGNRLKIEDESAYAEGIIFLYRHSSGRISFGPTKEVLGDALEVDSQEAIFPQFRDPKNYPQLAYLGDQFGNIRFFRGWPLGRNNALRQLQDASFPSDFLLEDGSNLGLILNDLQNRRETKRLLLEKLRLVYERIEDVTTKVQGGAIQIFFHEEGLANPVPAARLSDGTLHYLCLLTILLHPDPPPLICIEEPELGLHPDVIPHIADLLLDASKRTQLIVTTHSETLVSRLSDVPESIVICERNDQGTHLRRLEPDKLKEWLERYSLGDLWRMGEIGGNRW